MILPKELLENIEYFEHTVKQMPGAAVDDVFIIHFKQWWKRKRKIRIAREIFNDDGDSFNHRVSPSAADLYNQLQGYALETFEEKLDSVEKKYEKDPNHDNVVHIKPKPKMDE